MAAPAEIPDAYADLVTEPIVATLGTINDSGSIQLTGIWTERDGSSIWVNTNVTRVKYKNMKARPDVTLIWYDPKNPYRFVSITGKAVEFVDESDTERGQWVTSQIDGLAERYIGQTPYPFREPGEVRASIRIEPTRVLGNG
jgi:PPOX class probable F420-dependent enzyme